MAANTVPIFPLAPKVSWGTTALTTANTAKDGTGTMLTVMTAGSNGARVDYLRVRSIGTNVATVLRVFINNGSTNATSANNVLFTEYTIAATTLSEVAASAEYTLTMDVGLPPGYTVNCAIGTTVAAGLMISAVYGDY